MDARGQLVQYGVTTIEGGSEAIVHIWWAIPVDRRSFRFYFVLMHLTYQFLLKPTRGQRRRLEQILEMQRLLYNGALDERISAYRKRGLSISKFAQQKSLKEVQDADPEGYGALASRLNRWTICRLDDAFQNFFSRVRKGQTIVSRSVV